MAEQDLPLGVELPADRVISAARIVAPPEWVQGQVEAALDEVTPYLIGKRDSFAINVPLSDRAEIALREVTSLLRETYDYSRLFDEVVKPAVKKAADEKLPLGVHFESGRLVEAARKTVTPAWLQSQVENALDEAGPYFVGRTDTFEINVQLADRAEIALDEIKALLRDADAYELLYSEVVEPELRRAIGGSVELPFGVSVTEDEVLSALRQVAPPQWVQERAEEVIDDAAPYLTGQVDSFESRVSLVENKQAAREVISDLVSGRAADLIGRLPRCGSLAEAGAALLNRDSRGFPRCIAPDLSADQILGRLGLDIAETVTRLVLGPVPDHAVLDDRQLRRSLVQAGAGGNLDFLDQVRELLRDGRTYTQDDLTRNLAERGGDVVDTLDEVREILRDGWTYTQDDLRRDLAEQGDDIVETLDGVRAFLAPDGWTYTEADFHEYLIDLPPLPEPFTGRVRAEDPAARARRLDDVVGTLDTARDYLKRSFELYRTFRWVVFLLLISLLASIGFLGGRSWPGRVGWAAAFLLVASGLVFLIWGPAYDNLAKSGPIYQAAGIDDLDELREEALDRIANPEKYNPDADGPPPRWRREQLRGPGLGQRCAGPSVGPRHSHVRPAGHHQALFKAGRYRERYAVDLKGDLSVLGVVLREGRVIESLRVCAGQDKGPQRVPIGRAPLQQVPEVQRTQLVLVSPLPALGPHGHDRDQLRGVAQYGVRCCLGDHERANVHPLGPAHRGDAHRPGPCGLYQRLAPYVRL